MSRTNSLYKERYNDVLTAIAALKQGENLPPETTLSKSHGISRTTVRAVLEQLNAAKIIRWDGRSKLVLRHPKPKDYFPLEETQTTSSKVENAFMQYVLNSDLKPGVNIRESDLVREFGVSASAIREYLIRFSRFGLIEKEPNRHWVLRGFTRNYAEELFDIREMFEMRAVRDLVGAPLHPNDVEMFTDLKRDHDTLLKKVGGSSVEFAKLDERLHRAITQRLRNRFIDDFYEVVALIFHYHYRWRKSNEKERNLVALNEHRNFLTAVLAGKPKEAEIAFRDHLNSARRTLLESVQWD